eukprot:2469643-Rhodomonas_salina.3
MSGTRTVQRDSSSIRHIRSAHYVAIDHVSTTPSTMSVPQHRLCKHHTIDMPVCQYQTRDYASTTPETMSVPHARGSRPGGCRARS